MLNFIVSANPCQGFCRRPSEKRHDDLGQPPPPGLPFDTSRETG